MFIKSILMLEKGCENERLYFKVNRYYYTSNDNAYKLAWARALLELISESDIKGVEINQEIL